LVYFKEIKFTERWFKEALINTHKNKLPQLVKKWQIMGSFCDKKKQFRTEEKCKILKNSERLVLANH
jgi:hypothetical protein